jgi:hypothetical protein
MSIFQPTSFRMAKNEVSPPNRREISLCQKKKKTETTEQVVVVAVFLKHIWLLLRGACLLAIDSTKSKAALQVLCKAILELKGSAYSEQKRGKSKATGNDSRLHEMKRERERHRKCYHQLMCAMIRHLRVRKTPRRICYLCGV